MLFAHVEPVLVPSDIIYLPEVRGLVCSCTVVVDLGLQLLHLSTLTCAACSALWRGLGECEC